ncbi:MAG: ABC transporter ATP-binding protein [Parachlamydiales bacterium]|jgi:oligopeptide/dipeptide ABC transporter ATP-binding protein
MKKNLSVKDLEVQFEKRNIKNTALRKISFDLHEKEIIAFVGESGSGKSTIALSIMKLLDQSAKVTNGQIFFNDEDILKKNEKEIRNIRGKQISIIFQDPLSSLNPTMKIGKQILEAIADNPSKSKVYELLKKVGIKDQDLRYDQYPHQISGGMRQRIMIAIAIASNPKIIIADEPTTSLDPFYQLQILDLLKKINEENSTSIIFISHDLSLVSNIASRIYIMYSGEIIENSTTENILSSPKHPYTKLLIDSIPKIDEERKQLPQEISTNNLIEKQNLCLFYERCPQKKEVCSKAYPLNIQSENDHFVACHLYKKKIKLDLKKWMKDSSELKI